jgi:hypothetical protein
MNEMIGRSGRPHAAPVKLSRVGDRVVVNWGSRDKELSFSPSETTIERGKTTKPFQRDTASTIDASLCLSIVTKERSLDLQANDTIQRDRFINAINALFTLIRSSSSA